MKRGFTLIELMVATLISSMIITGLLTALYYTTRIQTNIDNTSSFTMRLAMVKRQMERDVGGFFAPRPVVEKEEEEKPAEEKAAGEQKSEQAEKEASKKEPAKKPAIKEVRQVFQLETQDGRLKQFTFITDNAMQVYWGTKQEKPVPRAARVVYRLKEDATHKKSFELTRQEGYELDLNAYKLGDANVPRAYPIIEGIKELTATVYTLKIKEPQEDTLEQSPEQEKAEYEKTTQWEYPFPEEKQKEKQKTALLPRFVEIKLTLWDNQYKYDQSFTFTLPIVVQAKGYKVKKPEEKPAQAQLPTPGPTSKQAGTKLPSSSREITQFTRVERKTIGPTRLASAEGEAVVRKRMEEFEKRNWKQQGHARKQT